MCGEHAARRMQQSPQQRGGHAVRRAGHDVERTPRQPQVGRVGLHDDDRAAELGAQPRSPRRMPFNRDHAGAGVEERPRYRAEAGADIEDERAGREFCVVD